MRPIAVLAVAVAGFGAGAFVSSRASDPESTTVTVSGPLHGAVQLLRPKAVPAANGGTLAGFVPPDAQLERIWTLPAAAGEPEQRVATWSRHLRSANSFFDDSGVAVWNRDGDAWRRAYTVRGERHGIEVTRADLTGDGHVDLLVRDHLGGTGAVINYRALVTKAGRVREVYSRILAMDDGVVRIARGALHVSTGFDKDRASDGLHCCWRRVHVTVSRWDGRKLAVVQQYNAPNRGVWPPSPG